MEWTRNQRWLLCISAFLIGVALLVLALNFRYEYMIERGYVIRGDRLTGNSESVLIVDLEDPKLAATAAELRKNVKDSIHFEQLPDSVKELVQWLRTPDDEK